MDQNLFIFVTGVVGRAMGSGKYTPGDIPTLTKAAVDAFEESFGTNTGAAMPAQPAVPAQTVMPAQVGHSQHISVAVDAIMAKAGDAPPGFDAWKDKKAYYGRKDAMLGDKPMRDATWAELLWHARSGSDPAKQALTVMANSRPDPGSKYYEQDKTKAERAAQLKQFVGRR